MQEKEQIYTSKNLDEDEINLLDLYRALIKGRMVIFYIITFVSLLTLVFSLYQPNIYKSTAILVPVESNIDTRSSGSISSLASLAGVSLSAKGSDSNSVKAIQKLDSLSFFENNFLPFIFLPNLMALESWDHVNNSLLYDSNIYDKNSNKWIRSFSYPKKQKPSAQESFSVFQEKHFTINEDSSTGFVTIEIRHQSPYIAKKWIELLIKEINLFYREKDKLEAQRASDYLNKQIAMTTLSEVKEVLAELLQQEIQKLALIEATQSYVFDYIDPPAVMEQKSSPKRILNFILSLIFGSVLGIFIVLIRNFGSKLLT